MMQALAKNVAQARLTIDVIVQADQWAAHSDAEDVVRHAIGAAARASADGGVAVLLTDNATIRQMNAQWRNIDKPTNVLSFPANGAATGGHLGDIAIAYETVAAESKADHKAFLDHLAHLAIHGYLHLVGFDHEDDADASRMERLETDILANLSIADPYADRTAGN